MAWQGVPLPFKEIISGYHSYLQIDRLPTIVIDSGFPWENVLGSFIAACIPAFIAWKTIKNSQDLVRQQVYLNAHQKKIEELREKFATYISQLTSAATYADLIYDEYDGDRAKVPFEKVKETHELIYHISYSSTMILLMLGYSHPKYAGCQKRMEEIDQIAEDYFDDYGKNPEKDLSGLYTACENIMVYFSEILDYENERIKEKIY